MAFNIIFKKKIWHFQLNFATSRNGRIGPTINSLFFFGGKIGIFFSFKKEINKKHGQVMREEEEEIQTPFSNNNKYKKI